MSHLWQILVVSLCISIVAASSASDWQPAKGPLFTRWAKDVKPDSVLKEYPRPQMVRKAWQNLNGLWDLAVQGKDAPAPSSYGKKILVPFPVESALSGVMEPVKPDQRVWYRRTFTVPSGWMKSRVLLHFDAVDWDASVWVNGREVGRHTGGYDPFTFDVTDALKAEGEQEIMLSVWDPTNEGTQPTGKQALRPGGCSYTAVTGIWRTVWLEPVPRDYVEGLKIVPDVDKGRVAVTVTGKGAVRLQALDGRKVVSEAEGIAGKAISLPVPDAKLWSPSRPFLYGLKVTLLDGKGRKVDAVDSYFGMRKVALGKDKNGVTRMMLNGKPLFMAGPLDQGFWPDGIYTAPTDEALRYDIEATKQMGFNMARKHVKVEPARWYYWADKLGLLVFQDIVSSSVPDPANFEKEMRAMVAATFNSPCIVMWVVFNEGWGQHDSKHYVDLARRLDPDRLITQASGWNDEGLGDVEDWHVYPGPASPTPSEHRAAVLGEFGGLGFTVPGHVWNEADSWGYVGYKNADELTQAQIGLFEGVHLFIASPGLSACVYTQTTDVETECNGFMTYDRAMFKMDLKKLREAVLKLYGPAPRIDAILPTSEKAGLKWRYTTDQPASGWFEAGFDDSAWAEGVAGFGTRETPGAVVRTEWNTKDIWIRRTFELPEGKTLSRPMLLLHHDEDAEVYVDGRLVGRFEKYRTGYGLEPFPKDLAGLLKPGKHTIAVHCRQTDGGQYVDVGIVDKKDPEK